MLDDVEPSNLYGLFDKVRAAVGRADALPSMARLNGHALIAMDGAQYFASNKLSCRNCSTRRRASGQIDYFHTVVAPASSNPARIGFCLYGRNSSNPSKVTTSKAGKPSFAPLARIERLSLQQAQSGVSGR